VLHALVELGLVGGEASERRKKKMNGKGSARVDQHNSRVDVELPRSIRTGRASLF